LTYLFLVRREASVKSRHHGGGVLQEWRTNENAARRDVRTALFTIRICYQSTTEGSQHRDQEYRFGSLLSSNIDSPERAQIPANLRRIEAEPADSPPHIGRRAHNEATSE
jgi:hypothetical protein